MQVVDSASVVKSNPSFKFLGKVSEAEARNHSCKETDAEGACRIAENSAGGSNNDTTCQSCVQNVLHRKLFSEKSSHDEGAETASSQ